MRDAIDVGGVIMAVGAIAAIAAVFTVLALRCLRGGDRYGFVLTGLAAAVLWVMSASFLFGFLRAL